MLIPILTLLFSPKKSAAPTPANPYPVAWRWRKPTGEVLSEWIDGDPNSPERREFILHGQIVADAVVECAYASTEFVPGAETNRQAAKVLADCLAKISFACRKMAHPGAPVVLSESHVDHLREIANVSDKALADVRDMTNDGIRGEFYEKLG